MRSMAQPQREVSTIAMTSTMSRASAMDEIPSHVVRIRKKMSEMKADSMKTSPWAKFTMPMMPKTIV
jgi:hypothetical protein